MVLKNFSQNLSPTKNVLIDISNNTSVNQSDLIFHRNKVISYFLNCLEFKSSDKVIIFIDNSINYVIALLALLEIDVIIVPLNTKLNRLKLNYFLGHSEAKFILSSNSVLDQLGWVNEINCDVISIDEIFNSYDDTVKDSSFFIDKESQHQKEKTKFILYTSGTTNDPKGVMISLGSFKNKIVSLINILGLHRSHSFFSFLPFFSGHGMIPGFLVPFFSGCKVYIGKSDGFLAYKFWDLINEMEINYFTSVPSILFLLKENFERKNIRKIPFLRKIFCASAPLSQSIFNWFSSNIGIRISNCYGLTETASWIAINSNNDLNQANYIGSPVDSEIDVYDHDGNGPLYGVIGELWIKGPYNMLGYYKASNNETSGLQDGYLKTGDLGYKDDQGNIFLKGRIKDLVIRKGINIYPTEVDEVFIKHPNVRSAVSFGVSDQRVGERLITALVIKGSSYCKEDYFRFVSQYLPVYLISDDIMCVKEFPMNSAGKILKDTLTDIYQNMK